MICRGKKNIIPIAKMIIKLLANETNKSYFFVVYVQPSGSYGQGGCVSFVGYKHQNPPYTKKYTIFNSFYSCRYKSLNIVFIVTISVFLS